MQAGTRLGPYEVVALLGAGGMGEVYRARDTRLGRDVALKVVHPGLASDPERLSRFEKEARAAAQLDHPNILVVHDVGAYEGNPFIVSELLQGESLREKLGAPLLPKKAVDYAIQIARGLAAAHEKGIVHRDIKPENVFVTKDGHVKILDFGIAKLLPSFEASGVDTETPTASATQPGTAVGTVAYMSPEQIRGQPVDARTDLFSLGVVLYEMLSGKRPFQRDTAAEIMTAILREEPPDLSETNRSVPAALENVVRHCLEKDPERRFQSARDVVFALEALPDVSNARPAVPMSASGVFVHRHRAAVVVTAFLIALGLGAGWWWRARAGLGAAMKRVAVLPFENLSGDPGQEYLSDGLTQEMISQLGRLHPASLSVIARTSVMQYKKANKPVDQIGRELGVDYVLEGSARGEAGRIRISAELIRVRDQMQIWADSFERDLSGILALQSDVAQKVAAALALKLLPAEQSRIAGARTVNPEAYEAYLKGLQHWYKLTPGDMDAAQHYYEMALAKDANYALAYAGIAMVWLGRSQTGLISPGEAAAKGKPAIMKAVELDDTIAETHYVLACFRTWSEWDWAGAEPEFKRAIGLNPSFPDAPAYYSHFLMHMGRSEEALAQIRRALELDPFNALFHGLFGVDLLYLRRHDDAIAQARMALQTGPDDPIGSGVLWYAFAAKGMHKEAFPVAKVALKPYGDRELDEALDQGYKEAGYRGAMKRAADALVAHFHKSYANPTDIAQLFVEAGEPSRAVEWLEKGYEVRDQNMPYLGMPIYDSLRGDPRFTALLRKMNLPVS